MKFKAVPIALCMLHLASALPIQLLQKEREIRHLLEDLEDADNSESVNSNMRGTRDVPSNEGDYYRSDEHEGNGEIGYSRKKQGGGKKGYQHFDSYHKKAGDNYEFEKQDSYGLEDKGQDGAYSHRHETKVRKDKKDKLSPENEREIDDFDEAPEEYKDLRKQKESKEENEHAALREGADDGNGGIEAYGHDPKDYTLPEKYTYGQEDDAYDF